MRSRRRVVSVTIALSLVAGACTEHVSPGVYDTLGKSADGSYSLSTINGGALPFTLAADGSYSEQITGGALVLQANGTYVARTTTADVVSGMNVGSYLDSTWGTWSRIGPALTLRSSLDTTQTSTGTWTGNGVSVIDKGTGTQLTLLYGR